MEIPKTIHYCWFGKNPLPEKAIECIESWKKFCPDYEIKEWNEDNFDVNICPYVQEAYENKKWAFVSDYARFWILYHEGGLYFDTDVEIVSPIDDIVKKGPFMGVEQNLTPNDSIVKVAPGLGLGAFPKMKFYSEMLSFYEKRHFINRDGINDTTTVVEYTTSLLEKDGIFIKGDKIEYCNGIYIYPSDYFCPMNYSTGVITITENTKSIHHYSATWHSPSEKIVSKISQTFLKYGTLGRVAERILSLPFRICVKIEKNGLKGTIRFIINKILKHEQYHTDV